MDDPKSSKTGRGSKIDRLPAELKVQLSHWIESREFTIDELTKKLNEALPNFTTSITEVSRTAVGRKATEIANIAADLRESQKYAEALNSQFELENLGETGQLLTFMLQQCALKTTSHMMADGPIDPETLGELVLSVQRLQRTNTVSAQLKQQIEEQARKSAMEAAASAAESVVKQAGLTAEGADLIRKQILGLA